MVRLKPVILWGQQRTFGSLKLMASFELSSPHPRFGGLSALTFSADGERLIFVSDRGHWFSARTKHHPDGALQALVDWRDGSLLGPKGEPFVGKRRDAESLSTDSSGALFVGFENYHRVLRYAHGLGKRPTPIAVPPELKDSPGNGSLEALTTLPDGRLLLLCERFRHPDGSLRGWLSVGTPAQKPLRWQSIHYVGSDDFNPTAVAALPTGEVLVLERFFSPFRGMAARIRHIDAADLRPGARIKAQEIARLDRGLIDNFEGLAVRYEKGTGSTHLYIVSDDNFNALQRTLLYQFRLSK
ncbi:MAG: esterase-like activity of phytase family protein [Deltaproteobacteria bacterium]|nr:esterase-like activity of phytase family protein [Deltaproteobacteria bacterium]